MLALPHFSARLIVGIGSGCVAAVAWSLARSMPGFPNDPHLWLRRLVVRSVTDVRRRDRVAVAWIGVWGWSAVVTVLHFGGLAFGTYPAVPWWDILTHAMGGFGVAALALLTHRAHVVASGSIWWVVPAVAAIGAGFEVYEFVFKSFWHGWTLRQYAVDTIVDLGVDAIGATAAGSVANGWRAMVEAPQFGSPSGS